MYEGKSCVGEGKTSVDISEILVDWVLRSIDFRFWLFEVGDIVTSYACIKWYSHSSRISLNVG